MQKMDYAELDAIEKRVAELEEKLGFDDVNVARSIPADIDAVKSKLLNHCQATILMKVPKEKLQLIEKYATETSGPLGDLNNKVESVMYAEQLINERADRMKTFEDALEACLDEEVFKKVADLEPELNDNIAKYEKALEEWREIFGQFTTTADERGTIIQRLTEKIIDVQGKIAAAKQKR